MHWKDGETWRNPPASRDSPRPRPVPSPYRALRLMDVKALASVHPFRYRDVHAQLHLNVVEHLNSLRLNTI